MRLRGGKRQKTDDRPKAQGTHGLAIELRGVRRQYGRGATRSAQAAAAGSMTVRDRRRELGMLRLVGATRRQVMDMLRWEGLLVAVAGIVLGTAIAAATLIPMMRGLTGESPCVPPLVYGSFAGAAVGLALLAVTLPARAALRDREG